MLTKRLKTILLQRKVEMPHLADPLANSSLPSTILHVTFLSQNLFNITTLHMFCLQFCHISMQLSAIFLAAISHFNEIEKGESQRGPGGQRGASAGLISFQHHISLMRLYLEAYSTACQLIYASKYPTFSTQVSRLSSKAGRAQEHRRKQYVANFEVQTNKNNNILRSNKQKQLFANFWVQTNKSNNILRLKQSKAITEQVLMWYLVKLLVTIIYHHLIISRLTLQSSEDFDTSFF